MVFSGWRQFILVFKVVGKFIFLRKTVISALWTALMWNSFMVWSGHHLMTTMRPFLRRPVRPMRWTRRMGLFCASKHTIRSTSPMSNPSSPTHVDTSVLKPPSLNLRTTYTTAGSLQLHTVIISDYRVNDGHKMC